MAPPSGHPLLRHCNQSRNMGNVVELNNIRALTYEELKNYTNDFSIENQIGRFQFGRVYRGTVEADRAVERPVTVKIWEVPHTYYDYYEGDSVIRMMDEYALLRHNILARHQGLMKLYGYCCEGEHVGLVYDFESKDTVQNLITRCQASVDEFTWLDRVKVVLGFAELLVFLHREHYQNGPFVIRNIDPSTVMVDKNYNPKLYDFGVVAGGIFPHSRRHTENSRGCLGSVDIYIKIRDAYTTSTDVFAFGVLLTKLLSNKVDRLEDIESANINSWVWQDAVEEYQKSEESDGSDSSMMNNRTMVAACLQDNEAFFPEDGVKLSELAYDCLDDVPEDRPTMKEVLASLLKLQIVEKYCDKLGMEQMIMEVKEEQ